MKKILIIKHGAFGDMMSVQEIMRGIRNKEKTAKITLLTTPRFAPLMKSCPWINEIWQDPRPPRWQFWKMSALKHKLQKAAFTKVYDLQTQPRSRHYCRWLKNAPKGAYSIATQIKENQITPTKNALDWMSADITTIMKNANIREGYILLFPGSSSRHPQKRWPYYADLAKILQKQGREVAIIAGPDEMDLCKKIPAPLFLTDKNAPVTFPQMASLIRKAGFLIANDSGASHLAAYCSEVKGLILFGGHAEAKKTGLDKRFSIIEKQSINNISVAEVMNSIQTSLV
ncbi:MAG: glycosyltransferase family 9 protein [Parvibaculales bacterium]